MENRFWVVLLLLSLASCARREPVRHESGPAQAPKETPSPVPLQVKPAPQPPPHWSVPRLGEPELKPARPFLSEPGLEFPHFSTRAPAWEAPHWDRRFDQWHYANLRYQELPKINWKLDLEFSTVGQKDIFKKMYVPVNNIDSVLDQIEREQQARREQYVDFPIKLNMEIPY